MEKFGIDSVLMRELRTSKNAETLARDAADLFVEIAFNYIQKNGRFSVALSGGSTPKALYSLLAGEDYRSGLDWSRVFFYFGDERNVLPDDQRSNFRMADETLFRPLRIEEANVFRWKTEVAEPETVAAEYRQLLTELVDSKIADACVSTQFPQFDLILLGLGADGHTASLFSDSKALHETDKSAVINWVPQMEELRFTITFPVINNAANIAFLVSGEDKASTVSDVIEGEYRPNDLPAQRVQPDHGKLIWMLDDAAAALLTKD